MRRYKLWWVLAMPRIDPPIARDRMTVPPSWPKRLTRQVISRTRIRDCCWHHSIDWRDAAAAAIPLARRINREHITDPDELADRAFDLVRALRLPERQEMAVHTLLNPHDGINLDHLGYDRWRLSYINGRKRTYAMLEAGVHRTVLIRWRAVPGN
jgi:hypothetical protein